MNRLRLTAQLAHEIEQSDSDYSVSRLDGMRMAPENPLQIEIARFGDAVAFLIRGWPDFWYGNKVLGLNPANVGQLDEIKRFFHTRDLPFRVEITPWNMDRELATRLYDLGFCHMSFSTALFGRPRARTGGAAGSAVRVRQVQPDETDLFLDLYQDGFGLPRLTTQERQVVQTWLDRDQAARYLCIARVDEAPAGIGLLSIKDGVGLLADAATLPAFRGQGCHAALLDHRIAAAAGRGCRLLTSFVEFGSTSHRNLERAGLRVAYTKALWWEVEPTT